MLKCRIRVGGYDKKMKLSARACGRRATHLAGGHPICAEHTQRLARDSVNYNLHPDGATLPRTAKMQKIAA
jgi:hypothetical protein